MDLFNESPKDRFKELLLSVKRPGIEKLYEWLVSSDFFEAPASSSHHGATEGGLLNHSLAVYDAGRNMIGMLAAYDILLEKNTWTIVSLLHDVCKANFYTVEMRNKKDHTTDDGVFHPGWNKFPFYAIDDQFPCGHGEKSVILAMKFIALTDEEIVAIRWHMAFSDASFKDYGGSRSLGSALDMCPLIVALHMADLATTYFDKK